MGAAVRAGLLSAAGSPARPMNWSRFCWRKCRSRAAGRSPPCWDRPGGCRSASAAIVNGAASHALDFDDVNLAMPGHPSVAILPALLALAEERGSSGADVLTAFVAGYELQCRIGRTIAPGHYDGLGFHATATVGSFGAAASCAHLLRLDADQFATALGIAGTQAAGLKSMFGTMCKPLHAGKAAYHGVMAAKLAARGFTSRLGRHRVRAGFCPDSQSGLQSGTSVRYATGRMVDREQFVQVPCVLLHDSCRYRIGSQVARTAWIRAGSGGADRCAA